VKAIKKWILFLMFLFTTTGAYALPISPIIPFGATLPATCRTGSLFIDTDADTDGALYQCVDTDTWKIVSGSGSGTVDISGTPVALDIARFTDDDTIEGLSYAEFIAALGLAETSVIGDSIGTGLTLDGTTLKTHAALQSIAGQTETAGGILYGTADNGYDWLAAGATTKILVGGGAAAPVWTEAEGSGAPVRATSPTLTTPNIGAATGTSFTAAKSDGVGGQMGVYEVNSTDTSQTGWKGAASIADDQWFQFNNTDPAAGQMMIFGAPSTNVSQQTWQTYSKEAAWTIVDSDTVTAVADGKQAFVVPASMNLMLLTDVTCSVADLNSASGGATTVVLRRVRAGTPQDMTSTGVTIDYNAYTASDETVDASYDDLATGDSIYVDVNAVTTGAVQKGLSCTAVFSLP